MALKSGSLNLNGMFETWSLFGWFLEGSVDCVTVVPVSVVSAVEVGGAAAVSGSGGCCCSHVVYGLAGLLTGCCCSAVAVGWGGGLKGGPAAGGGSRGASFTSAFISPFWAANPAGAAAPNGALIPVCTMCCKKKYKFNN